MVDEHVKKEEQAKAQQAELHESLIASLQLLAGKQSPPQVDANASAIEALKMLAGSMKNDRKTVNVSALKNLTSPVPEVPPAPKGVKPMGILSAATRPKGKPMKGVDFPPIVAPPDGNDDTEASVAATKLMQIVYSMGSGERKGSP